MPRVAEIFKDESSEWRWHVKAANGEIIAQGEGYTTKQGARRGLDQAHIEYDKILERGKTE